MQPNYTTNANNTTTEVIKQIKHQTNPNQPKPKQKLQNKIPIQVAIQNHK